MDVLSKVLLDLWERRKDHNFVVFHHAHNIFVFSQISSFSELSDYQKVVSFLATCVVVGVMLVRFSANILHCTCIFKKNMKTHKGNVGHSPLSAVSILIIPQVTTAERRVLDIGLIKGVKFCIGILLLSLQCFDCLPLVRVECLSFLVV